MARKPEIAELPTRVLLTEIGSGKRYKRLFLFGGVGVVVLAAGIVALVRAADARRVAARNDAFGTLGACVLGAEPLAEGELPSVRVSNIKLAVAGTSSPKRQGWPASCAKDAFALSALASHSPLGDAAEGLAKALEADANATNDIGAKVDAFWTEATNAKLKASPAPADAQRAPKPAVPILTPQQFGAIPKFLSGAFRIANVREEPAPGKKLYFLVDEKEMPEGAVLCAGDVGEASFKCQKVPSAAASLSPGLRLIGTTDDGARPFLFAGDRGQLGIFSPDGKGAVGQAITYGAASHKDGSFAFLSHKEKSKDLTLTVQPAVGAASEETALPAADYDGATKTALMWDWLVWRSAAKPGTASHLFARKLVGSKLEETVDVGELEMGPPVEDADHAAEPQVTACRSDDAIAVRVRGDKGDVLAFLASGRWSAPVTASTHGGMLTCRGLEAVATTVEHSNDGEKDFPTITQAKCNTGGCTTTTVSVRKMLAGASDIAPIDASNVAIADVGGKLMILWNSGPIGGLRMRLAAADQIMDAPDVILANPRVDKGGTTVSSVLQMRAIPTNGAAFVFFNTTSGVKAIRVEPNGKVTPVEGAT